MSSTSWPASWRSAAMNTPTLPAPAMATFMSVPPRRAAGELGVEVGEAVLSAQHVQHVALLTHELRLGHLGVPAPCHRDDPEAVAIVDLGQLAPGPRGRNVVFDETELTARVVPVGVALLGKEPAH